MYWDFVTTDKALMTRTPQLATGGPVVEPIDEQALQPVMTLTQSLLRRKRNKRLRARY